MQNHSECLGLKLFVEDGIRMRRRDMHVGEDKRREHEKDIQGSLGFEDKGYIWPHKLVSDQKNAIFLATEGCSCVSDCYSSMYQKLESLVYYLRTFICCFSNVLGPPNPAKSDSISSMFFWRIHAFFGPPSSFPETGAAHLACEANPSTTWRAPRTLAGQMDRQIGWWLGVWW